MHPNPPQNDGQGQGYGPQYGQPYGQPEPQYGQPYGQPSDHTSPGMYNASGPPYGGDPAAAQPSAVPYTGQASAPPYNAPAAYGQPPAPDYGQPLGPPMTPPKPKKKFSLLPLALMCGALVLVIGGVVAIVVLRESGSQQRQTAEAEQSAAAAKSKAPVDECLVGTWKQVDYRKDVPLDEAGVGTVRLKGPKDGSAIEITIEKDGKFTEIWDDVIYEGTSKNNKTVRSRLTGEFTYKVRTEGGKIIKDQPDGSGTSYIDVDGKPAIKIPLDPTGGQTTYACEGSDAFSFSNDDDYYNKFKRVKK